MAKFQVEVRIVSKKTLSIYARDEEAAGEKAVEIVLAWDGVEDVEVVDAEEE